MTFRDILAEALTWLQQDQRVSYRALKRQFHLDDAYFDDLKDAMLYAHPVTDDGRGLMWTGAPATPEADDRHGREFEGRFHALLPDVMARLQRDQRVTYRTLQYVFGLNDALLAKIREELAFRQLAIDEHGNGLVWTGETPPSQPNTAVSAMMSQTSPPLPNALPTASQPARHAPEAERRQLTVMFCDLVGSTDLSGRLDPEDLREVVQAYQEAAANVIERYEGHIAQYLGDGLLVYFGWPQAHENDAERAVRTGLEIPEAIARLHTRLDADCSVNLAVRIGIHTGPVVVGEMGGGERHEHLALGETPNIAARLEGLAQPGAVVISPVTAQLVQRSFILEELGPHDLKGVADAMTLYAVAGPRHTEYDDHEGMLAGGFDALVGRDEEIGLLRRRWQQSKEGQGQVVFISGEAGLGKSSLVEGLRAHIHQEGYRRIAFRCSPYTANSAMHPVIEHVQRVLSWEREDSTETRLDKLERAIQPTSLPVEETAPLLAAFLSLPAPEGRYPALSLSPQRQRQLTQDALVAWMLEEAERQPVLAVWEDLHWADPSTLELLGLFIDQTPTVPMMHVLAYRPEFAPPWPMQSHMTPITLPRLERNHIEALVIRLAGGKTLPPEVVAHVVAKTDGVPLYVEELTKMLLESSLLTEESEQYVLTGALDSAAIPDSLQASLMARLDRLPSVKEVAQLGAVLGREFDYEMLQALAVVDETTLQTGLSQLVAHELLYQRGRIPRAKFIFRHVLIRDAAYQSLLRRVRQHYHQLIAQTLEARFPETAETQPELVAHHYTEAGYTEQAISYWQRASEWASKERSAYQEAISHLTTALTLLQTLPETVEQHQQELRLQTAFGTALGMVRGQTAPEVEVAYTRAHFLSQQLGDTQNVFPVLLGLWRFHNSRGDFSLALQFGEELLELAERRDESSPYVMAHYALSLTRFFVGDLRLSKDHSEEVIESDQPTQLLRVGQDLGVGCRAYLAFTLWALGYPDQALERVRDALELATQLNHLYSDAFALVVMSIVCHFRREEKEAYQYAEGAVTLSSEQGFAQLLALGAFLRGWALAGLGQNEEGLMQMRQGLADRRSAGVQVLVPHFQSLLAEAYGNLEQIDRGLDALREGFQVMARTGECWWKADMHRLQGELLLRTATPDVAQAESCFQQALDIARRQKAKSLELRAAISLARLWQSQSKRREAHDLLAPVYEWFTEGLDTVDLKDAKTLLET